MSVENRIALVTGASSGFGQAIARALESRGCRVYGTSRRAPAGNEQATPRMVAMDVDDDRSVHSGVAQVIAQEGRIDILVSNAGFGIAGAIEDTSDEEAREQLETNFFGTHRVCRAVLPHMRDQRAGRILITSSLGGLVSTPFQAFYCASKFAIEAYAEALRMEVMPFGIQVSMIEPGDYATSFTGNRRMVRAAASGSAYGERCTRAIAQMREDEGKNTDLSPVVAAAIRAIESRSPRLRYPVASMAQRLIVGLRPFIPQRAFERVIMDTYKIR